MHRRNHINQLYSYSEESSDTGHFPKHTSSSRSSDKSKDDKNNFIRHKISHQNPYRQKHRDPSNIDFDEIFVVNPKYLGEKYLNNSSSKRYRAGQHHDDQDPYNLMISQGYGFNYDRNFDQIRQKSKGGPYHSNQLQLPQLNQHHQRSQNSRGGSLPPPLGYKQLDLNQIPAEMWELFDPKDVIQWFKRQQDKVNRLNFSGGQGAGYGSISPTSSQGSHNSYYNYNGIRGHSDRKSHIKDSKQGTLDLSLMTNKNLFYSRHDRRQMHATQLSRNLSNMRNKNKVSKYGKNLFADSTRLKNEQQKTKDHSRQAQRKMHSPLELNRRSLADAERQDQIDSSADSFAGRTHKKYNRWNPNETSPQEQNHKNEVESKYSGKGNLLHHLEHRIASHFSSPESLGGEAQDFELEGLKKKGTESQGVITQKVSRGSAKTNKKSICKSEYSKRKNLLHQSRDIDITAPSPYGSISCNVTEQGDRKKLKRDKQKSYTALKQGDSLYQNAEKAYKILQAQSPHYNNQIAQTKITTQLKEQQSDEFTGVIKKQPISKQVQTRKQEKKLQNPQTKIIADNKSNDSKKSKYQKLVINVTSANAPKILQQEGIFGTNLGASKPASSRHSRQLSSITTPSPSVLNGAASSLPIPSLKQPKMGNIGQNVSQNLQTIHSQPQNSQILQPQPSNFQQQQTSQKQQSIAQISHPQVSQQPIKKVQEQKSSPPVQTQQKQSHATDIQDHQSLQQITLVNNQVQAEIRARLAQRMSKEQRDLMEQAVSPFHQSQVSYSDYKQYQNYFHHDNKDGYFSPEQVQYYTEEYPKTLDKNVSKPKPITKWKLGKMIGHGSFGNVYVGMDNTVGRQIAVKQVPISKIGTNQGTQQRKIRALKQEIKLLNSLQHKNIVKYLGTQEDSEYLNVFLEYVSQGSLEEHYKNYNFSEKLVANYTQQILLGLEYLHYNNIVHRDIKAANILFRDDGTCQLADFGSSKKIIETNKNETKSFCGTPFWMAPEVIKQTGHNRFADIWSLGCTVYEMVAKRPPWNDENNQVFKVLNKIATADRPPKYPKGISPALKDFLDCCFQTEPRMRANVYELLQHPFIKREELKTALAHQQRLAVINEQHSAVSDASPFGKHGGSYFNAKIVQKLINQKQKPVQNTLNTTNVQESSISPNSAKTQGNNNLAKLQFTSRDQNNDSTDQQQKKQDANKSMADFEDSRKRQIVTQGHSTSNSNHTSSQHLNRSNQQSSPHTPQPHPVTIEETKKPLQADSRTGFGSNRNTQLYTIQESPFVLAQTENLQAQLGEQCIQRNPRKESNERLERSQAMRVPQPASNANKVVITDRIITRNIGMVHQQQATATRNQRISHPVTGQPWMTGRIDTRPDTGNSDAEIGEEEKCKMSLGVDSTGGGVRQYSFAGGQDIAEDQQSHSHTENHIHQSESVERQEATGSEQDGLQSSLVDLIFSNRDIIEADPLQRPIVEQSKQGGVHSIHLREGENTNQQVEDFGFSPIQPAYDLNKRILSSKSVIPLKLKSDEEQKSYATPLVRTPNEDNFEQKSQIQFDEVRKDDGGQENQIRKSSFVKNISNADPEPNKKKLEQSPVKNALPNHEQDQRKKSSSESNMMKFAERFHRSRGQIGHIQEYSDASESTDAREFFSPNQTPQRATNSNLQLPLDSFASSIRNHGNLVSQLNKLSLDNNLTDIDEEDDENKSLFSKDQDSIRKRSSGEEDTTWKKLSGLVEIPEVTELSLDTSTIRQQQNQGSIKTESDGVDGFLSNGSGIQSNGSPGNNNNAFSSAGLKSSSKSTDRKLKLIEDEIYNEIAKAEAAKKTEPQQAKQLSQENNRMIKARKLLIPKIYVSNSNKQEGDSHSSSSGQINQSAQSSSLKGSIETPQRFAVNPDRTTNFESKVRQLEPEKKDETNHDHTTSSQNIEKCEAQKLAEKQVLEAIYAQINQTKKKAQGYQVIAGACSQGDLDSSDDSSYKSPVIDSDELDALDGAMEKNRRV